MKIMSKFISLTYIGNSLPSGQITYAFSRAIGAQLTKKNYHQLYCSLPRAAGLSSSIWPDPVPWSGHSFPVTCTVNSCKSASRVLMREIHTLSSLEDFVSPVLVSSLLFSPLGLFPPQIRRERVFPSFPFPEVNKQKLDPVPILLLLSSEGLLCPFHIINKESKESQQYRTEPLPTEGVSKGIAVRQTVMDGQPAGIGPQGSINLTTTTTGAMPPAPKPPTAQPSSAMPFSFKPPTQPGSTTQSGFSFSSSRFGRDGPVLSTAGSQVTQPTDDSRVPSTGAQTKPFSFSFQPSGVTSGTPPFSFAKAASSTTDAPSTSTFPSFTPPAPSTAQTVPFGTASSQGLFGSSSGVGQGTQSQGLFGSSTKTNQSQSSGTPFSFSKPAFSFNAPPGSTTSQASVPSTIASASGGQTSAPPAYPFARPSGSSDKPVAPSQPISGQAGPGQQTTGTLVAPTKAQVTVPPTSHAPVSNPPSVAPPNQVAPMMKSLPFVVTEEPQGASSQITLPKVQDVPKAPGNLSVTIPLEQRKSAMQAQRAAAAAAYRHRNRCMHP
ncbi:hypothetical protein BSL78_23453 [Apostichopus japonicus]|uniref:Nuclear pore complex protein n=1 Tax=Stichopus japonicus TaxID=307972 RepID=A0A2G8JVF4_STIJA|nr:hypothetical protein BSL78_23453 [Apostichopus japonicus]